MVSFTELVTLIQANKTKEEGLPVWNVVEPVRVWRLPSPTVVIAPPPVVIAPPTMVIAPPPMIAPPPVVIVPPIVVNTAAALSRNAGWSSSSESSGSAAGLAAAATPFRAYGRPLDLLSIGILDPLYNRAPRNTARDIEKEEAIRLEAMIPLLYGKEGGRSRGWTKKLLETHLRTRASIGGDLFELQKVKLGINGNDLFTCKEISALFDFLCLAKGIRCIVWKDPLHFGLWPAAEPAVLSKEPSLIHTSVNEIGELRLANGCDTMEDLFAWVDRTPGVGWTPALSCISILSTNTLDELKRAADAIGLVVTGKKSEQIVQIAAARRRRSMEL